MIERAISWGNSDYNDIANWSYAKLPSVFNKETLARTLIIHNMAQLKISFTEKKQNHPIQSLRSTV